MGCTRLLIFFFLNIVIKNIYKENNTIADELLKAELEDMVGIFPMIEYLQGTLVFEDSFPFIHLTNKWSMDLL